MAGSVVPGFVARKDAADHGAIAQAAVVSAVVVQILGALGQRRGILAFIGERSQDQAIHAVRFRHGVRAGAQTSRRFAEQMHLLLAGFVRDHFHARLNVFDAAGDVGIALGLAGPAVVFVIHGPDVVAEFGEDVHHRVLALAGRREVE